MSHEHEHEVTLEDVNKLHALILEHWPSPNVALDLVLCWLSVGLWGGDLKSLARRLVVTGRRARENWAPRVQTQPGGSA